MALDKDVNSYVDVAEADAYFADRIDADAWTSANNTRKEQALITATNILDEQLWIGEAVSVDQPLAFPRTGFYFDPRVGAGITLDNTTPARVSQATMELALHLLTNSNVLDELDSAIDIQVGSISIIGINKVNRFPSTIRSIVNPLIQNGGARTWWRAN